MAYLPRPYEPDGQRDVPPMFLPGAMAGHRDRPYVLGQAGGANFLVDDTRLLYDGFARMMQTGNQKAWDTAGVQTYYDNFLSSIARQPLTLPSIVNTLVAVMPSFVDGVFSRKLVNDNTMKFEFQRMFFPTELADIVADNTPLRNVAFRTQKFEAGREHYAVAIEMTYEMLESAEGPAYMARKTNQAMSSLNMTFSNSAVHKLFSNQLHFIFPEQLHDVQTLPTNELEALRLECNEHALISKTPFALQEFLKRAKSQMNAASKLTTPSRVIVPLSDALYLSQNRPESLIVGETSAKEAALNRDPAHVDNLQGRDITVDGVRLSVPPSFSTDAQGASGSQHFYHTRNTGSRFRRIEPNFARYMPSRLTAQLRVKEAALRAAGGAPAAAAAAALNRSIAADTERAREYRSTATDISVYSMGKDCMVAISKIDSLRNSLTFHGTEADVPGDPANVRNTRLDVIARDIPLLFSPARKNIVKTEENLRLAHELLFYTGRGANGVEQFSRVETLGQSDTINVSPDQFYKLVVIAEARFPAGLPATITSGAAGAVAAAAGGGPAYAANHVDAATPPATRSAFRQLSLVVAALPTDDDRFFSGAGGARVLKPIVVALLDMDMTLNNYQVLHNQNVPIPISDNLFRACEEIVYSRWAICADDIGMIVLDEKFGLLQIDSGNKVKIVTTQSHGVIVNKPWGIFHIPYAKPFEYKGGFGCGFIADSPEFVQQNFFTGQTLTDEDASGNPIAARFLSGKEQGENSLLSLTCGWNEEASTEAPLNYFDMRIRYDPQDFIRTLNWSTRDRMRTQKIEKVPCQGLVGFNVFFPRTLDTANVPLHMPLNENDSHEISATALWRPEFNFIVAEGSARYADGYEVRGHHFLGEILEGLKARLFSTKLPMERADYRSGKARAPQNTTGRTVGRKRAIGDSTIF